jgi:hypothetical protein
MSEVIRYGLPEHLAARRQAARREWSAQWLAAGLGLICLIGAGFFLPRINQIRQERQLVINPAALGTLPPDISLLGKLGTFRALAIDWAAMRAEKLKEEGKVYEAYELHKLVCALAPHFPDVWVYAAWNMAYNISVMQYTPQSRWQWVRNGINILRDEGIPKNPKAIKLYKELAWIYWHKIGDYLDDEHLNYKRALAVEMETVLGPPPVAFDEEEYYAWFRKIVEAPRDYASFVNKDPDIQRLRGELEKVGLSADETLLDFVARHIRPEVQVSELLKDAPADDSPFQRKLRTLKNPENEAALDRLLAALRSKVLREEYQFDLDEMMSLMVDQFGPLDWRNAFSHSLYWSTHGDKVCKGRVRNSRNDRINNARFILFSLQNLVTRGRITLWPNFDDPFKSYLELTPDTRFIFPYLFDQYMKLGKEHFANDPEFLEGTPGPNFMIGFVTNMENWVQLLYLEGGERNVALADQLYTWLRKNNPHPDGRTQERYLVSLDQFVFGDLREQMETYRAASAIVGSFIERALKQFALGQADAGLNSMANAVKCYNFWMRDKAEDVKERRKLRDPRLQLRDQIEAFVTEPQYAALAKARLWRGLPLEQRQMVYDRLLPVFDKICQAQDPPWSLERAFPEPPGMEEYRRLQPEPSEPDKEIQEGTRFKGD